MIVFYMTKCPNNVEMKYSQRICFPTFVVKDFLGFFLRLSTFLVEGSISA